VLGLAILAFFYVSEKERLRTRSFVFADLNFH